ncbi:MAG: ergothioneine biosynthesis glutamate--cysteine ligase EgtA [Jatrophihabitans sp.]|uniref:ergothioneine biosynthesis glutamate--cysteine ligase EgtA n=1 Tax=Jatrophihabitans sp. TaxID=1932789 RepID=UPI003F803074
MTASRPHAAVEPLLDLETAAAHIADVALTDGPVRLVGLELEAHLVPLTEPGRRPDGASVERLLADLPPLPRRSRVTEEPGGQIELSTPPAASLERGVADLRADRAALRAALAERGHASAAIGADPARPVIVVNRAPRYAAMQRHWTTVGCSAAGRSMMAATAALQVNLDAGPRAGWARRVEHLHRLGPALLALSACSPMLAGQASGWASMRQQMWAGIDQHRAGRIGAGDPVEAWTRYALAAPVMLVLDEHGGGAEPVPSRVSFASWITGAAKLLRRPTLRDLDHHLTTLFPAVRLRGYLEVRYLDAVPDRWWPGLAAIVATLADDPVAVDLADEACEPVADAWLAAARDGLADAAVWRAARACARIAADRAPADVAGCVASYAELVERRRTPGDELRERLAAADPVHVLREVADA